MKLRERFESAGLSPEHTEAAMKCVQAWLHDKGGHATRSYNVHADKLGTELAIEELPISPPLNHT